MVEQLFLIESTRAELEWPVEAAPSLVIFESDEPQFYGGDLGDTEAVLAWLRHSASKSSIRRFVITEKAPTRAFSWLKAATTDRFHI